MLAIFASNWTRVSPSDVTCVFKWFIKGLATISFRLRSNIRNLVVSRYGSFVLHKSKEISSKFRHNSMEPRTPREDPYSVITFKRLGKLSKELTSKPSWLIPKLFLMTLLNVINKCHHACNDTSNDINKFKLLNMVLSKTPSCPKVKTFLAPTTLPFTHFSAF